MSYLFSTPINRLMFLARLVATTVALAFTTRVIFLLVAHHPGSTEAALLAGVLSFVLVVPGLYYLMHFVIVARLDSIGLSIAHGFWMLLPSMVVILQELLTDAGIAWLGPLPWQPALFVVFLLYLLVLIVLPEDTFRQGNAMQVFVHDYEVGEGRIIIRIIPLIVVVCGICGLYNFGPVAGFGGVYHGLSDAQSMDNAQAARQLLRGQGFTTQFLRPYAVRQLRDHAIAESLGTDGSSALFPPGRFPPGVPRILPDTYNAPGYPVFLAGWFYLVRPNFEQSAREIGQVHITSPDRWIPALNTLCMLLTAGLVFVLGLRLFDQRVAWIGLLAFFGTNLVWQYTVTALSTSLLMLLITALLCCALEIFAQAEACATDDEQSFAPAWKWTILLSLLFAAACLTRLSLLVLLAPLLAFLLLLPRARPALFVLIALVTVGLVAPWFWHLYRVSGNPLGSNLPLLLNGASGYEGNQIYCRMTIPGYESLLADVLKKEYLGFSWHFEHAWDLLGCSPMILLFVASFLHQFRRPRARAFLWLLAGCAVAITAMNNLLETAPEALGPWNTVVLLFPAMLVMGTAFFFILLDRLDLPSPLLKSLVVIGLLAVGSIPLEVTLATPAGTQIYSFPPYVPPVIKLFGQFAQPDEWVTSDMPWASAWYADRPSLWLPDSIADFTEINDDICPSGVLFFTPVTWTQPVYNMTTGEERDWLPFIGSGNVPSTFPLRVSTATSPGGPDYTIFSDRARWQTQ